MMSTLLGSEMELALRPSGLFASLARYADLVQGVLNLATIATQYISCQLI